MGIRQSKEELLYEQVNYGNIEGIKTLHREGAGLEWIDKEGRTPLILACMRPDGLQVAKTLLELGANVNAYRPGFHAGTPLHHAAKKGLEQTVNLLLSHGANPMRVNDDCLTALDLAREKGHCNVVRTIENRVCLFSGWLREIYGPSFLETIASQWVSRKIWVVILQCGQRNPKNHPKFELVLYAELQQHVDGGREVSCRRRRRRRIERKAARPRETIPLWKAKIEEPNFSQPDPAVVIFIKGTKTRYKFLSANEGDKQQLQQFYNTCIGVPQCRIPVDAPPEGLPVHSPPLGVSVASSSAIPASASAPAPEDEELAMAINASIQSAIAEGVSPLPDMLPAPPGSNTNGWGLSDRPISSTESTKGWSTVPVTDSYNGWAVSEPGPSTSMDKHQSKHEQTVIVSPAQDIPPPISAPSAPPITEEMFVDGPVQYPSIDSSPVDLQIPLTGSKPKTNEEKDTGDASDSCVICLDAALEGACVPCGHMAGCMSCLNEIKAKGWGCPVCRAKIDQVIKLFHV